MTDDLAQQPDLVLQKLGDANSPTSRQRNAVPTWREIVAPYHATSS